jgi:hypothetical protein
MVTDTNINKKKKPTKKNTKELNSLTPSVIGLNRKRAIKLFGNGKGAMDLHTTTC